MNDEKLLNLYQRRDEEALNIISNTYGYQLRSLSLSILKDEKMAEECEQEAYRQAWDTCYHKQPYSYLYIFLANLTRKNSLEKCRKSEKVNRNLYLMEINDELEQCIPKPTDEECKLSDDEMKKLINQFLVSISGERRNLFLRRYWYMESIEDISKRFGLSERKVTNMLFSTRQQLCKYMKKEGYQV